jgi:hypothetical protein
MRVSRVVWIATFIVACDESQDVPAIDEDETLRRRCSELREHVVDLRVASATVDREQHRNALRNALGDRFVADCVGSYTVAAVECGLAAHDNDEIATCLGAGEE